VPSIGALVRARAPTTLAGDTEIALEEEAIQKASNSGYTNSQNSNYRTPQVQNNMYDRFKQQNIKKKVLYSQTRFHLLFNRLREHGLKLQPEKCKFLKRKIDFLGFHISEKGPAPSEEKISAVRNFPTPKDPKDIKSFLGLCGYYRRFIDNFAKHAEPLTNLTRKKVVFKWDEKCNKAIDHFKKCILRHFQRNKKHNFDHRH
jgi:hypothetical protein